MARNCDKNRPRISSVGEWADTSTSSSTTKECAPKSQTSSKGSVPSLMSVSENKLFRRKTQGEMTVNTATTSSTGRSYASSSGGGNIWTKLLGGKDELWDGLDGKGDVYDDSDDYFDDNSLSGFDGVDERGRFKDKARMCGRGMKRWGFTWAYEARHFVKTVYGHPHILLGSLLAFGIVCGVGITAVKSERDASIQKQKMTAEFVARETAQWFSNEFRRAMIPLYSVQQGVIHSGYFDSLADQIGPYPNLLIPESEQTPFTKRNVTGICDQPEIIQKWRDIVQPVNEENDLDGVVVGYRLFPNNVACLTEPHEQESTKHFDANDFPQGEALLASDNVFGLDTGHSGFPLWKMITTDLFVNKQFNIFGPFAMPPMAELICGHIAVWRKPDDTFDEDSLYQRRGQQLSGSAFDIEGALAAANGNLDRVVQPSLDVHGTEVEGAWGFVVNFLDWTKLKDKSNIYKRFSDCNFEFRLTRAGGATVTGVDSALLAESPKSDLLDATNSIVVQTESLHGAWENRVGNLSGWSPSWYPAAIAGVVLTSFLLALLTASTLVERQLHRNLLYKVLPRSAIAKLHRGQTVLEKFNLVTIFFSDIVGFTSMAGSMRPIQVMKMLNELYTELDKLVEKHKVYKVETIGDAYMVVGGAPARVPAPLAAERVALFAIDAVQLVKDFRTKDGDKIIIRAGLASGPTVAGVVGHAMPRYCFFGDTVNFASRMESTSKSLQIQCAEITFRLLLDAPNMNFELPKRVEGDIVGVNIKGKGHQVTYWIEKASLRQKSDRMIVSIPSDIETPSAGNSHHALSSVKEAEEASQDNMLSSSEICTAMTEQNWDNLGHAESALVAATEDLAKMKVRATALLELRLSRVLRERDHNARVTLSIKVQLANFVSDVAATYTNEAKFHNFAHAMHVTTSMNKLLSAVLTENPLNSFSLVFSALLHDAGHTGMSNKILTDSQHSLSLKYPKDVPIAERNSIDIGLEILFRSEYQTLRTAIIPEEMDKIHFAKTLFQSILVTDIATPNNVKLGLRRYEASQQENGECEAALCPLSHYIGDLFDGVGLDNGVKVRHPNEFIVTHDGLQDCVRNEHLMLLSDISHLLQGWENFIKFNYRLYQELYTCFKKGLCGAPRDGWFLGQVSFLDKYILPLAKRSHIYFDKNFSERLVNNGLTNLELWMAHGAEATRIMVCGADCNDTETDVLQRLYGLPAL